MHPKYFNLVLLDCMSEYNSDETEIFQMSREWCWLLRWYCREVSSTF